MNFMPSDDAFFDEQFHSVEPERHNHIPPQISSYETEAVSVSTELLIKLVESSLRQEALLERVVREVERLNTRMLTMELSGSSRSHILSDVPQLNDSKDKSKEQSKPTIPRGSLLLPPGSRPVLPNIGTRSDAPALIRVEASGDREKQEREAIEKLRLEEEERMAMMEAERKRIEEEEERARLEHLKKIEEERRQREELEKRTKGLLSNLITSQGSTGKGLFDSDNEDEGLVGSAGPNKPSKGIFDD